MVILILDKEQFNVNEKIKDIVSSIIKQWKVQPPTAVASIGILIIKM
jgi:hypothetical protein